MMMKLAQPKERKVSEFLKIIECQKIVYHFKECV